MTTTGFEVTDTLDIYVVRWPDRGIVKVGISKNERWRDFGSGVELCWTVQGPRDLVLAMEQAAHERLSQKYARPFRRGAQAVQLLRSNGVGFTECYIDDESIMSTILEVVAVVLQTSSRKVKVVLQDLDTPTDYTSGHGAGVEKEAARRTNMFTYLQQDALYRVVDGRAMDELRWDG